jgi:hypothetical protein
LNVLVALQSKKLPPTPFEWVVWHWPPLQHPGVAHSQPSVSGAVAALQSVRPALHLYEQVVPSQLAAPVLVLHAAFLHAPHVAVEESEDSQPFESGGVVSQSANPGAQPAYVQLLPEQLGLVLVFVSHDRPQAPQSVAVESDVSQPFVSGGVVLQSANPGLQLEYLQVGLPVVSHVAPTLLVVSHDVPHALHEADATIVSQPFVSGGVVSQSANPASQPVYVQVTPSLQLAPRLLVVSHALPHAPQLAAVDSDVSQPSVSGPEGSQSAQPGWQPLYWLVIPASADATHVAPML